MLLRALHSMQIFEKLVLGACTTLVQMISLDKSSLTCEHRARCSGYCCACLMLGGRCRLTETTTLTARATAPLRCAAPWPHRHENAAIALFGQQAGLSNRRLTWRRMPKKTRTSCSPLEQLHSSLPLGERGYKQKQNANVDNNIKDEHARSVLVRADPCWSPALVAPRALSMVTAL
eukprot:2254436-Lingulodinium_polyedra.AAC.2